MRSLRWDQVPIDHEDVKRGYLLFCPHCNTRDHVGMGMGQYICHGCRVVSATYPKERDERDRENRRSAG